MREPDPVGERGHPSHSGARGAVCGLLPHMTVLVTCRYVDYVRVTSTGCSTVR